MSTKLRVAAAAGVAFADQVPDPIYTYRGALLADFLEGEIHRRDGLPTLEWIVRAAGTLAEGKMIEEGAAQTFVQSLIGRCILTSKAPPPNIRLAAEDWLRLGRAEDPFLVIREGRELGDRFHRPRAPLAQAAPTAHAVAARAIRPTPRFEPTPFSLRDPASIPRRQWLYGTHLIRKEISATIAPGGVGKTSLGVVEAIALASGKPLLGVAIPKPLHVWLWNGEEPQEELDRRVHAACLHHGVTRADLADRLMVDNGHDVPVVLAEQTRDGTTIYEPEVAALVAALRLNSVDVMIVDPFVSTHNVTENDNNAIQKAASAWKSVAVQADVAIGLAHHTRKLNGREATAEDARGADALIAKARDARALNPMSATEASTLSVPPADRFDFFWTGPGGKSNMSRRTGRKSWFRMVSVGLGNGGSLAEPQDFVGVVEGWKPDYAPDELAADALTKLGEIMSGGDWRSAPQAASHPDWIGVAVADAFEINRVGEWLPEAKKIVRRLEAEGILVKSEVSGPHRKPVPVFVFHGVAEPDSIPSDDAEE